MRTRTAKLFALAVVIVLVILLGLSIWWYRILSVPLVTASQPAVEFVLPTGGSVTSLAATLHSKGLLKHPRAFVLLARLKMQTRSLQAGEYRIEPGTTAITLLQQLVSGKAILYSFTIVPGWTFRHMLQAVEADPHLQHNFQNLSATKIMQQIGFANIHSEGRFFPDTYKFHNGFSDRALLREAYSLMQQRLQQQWQGRAPKLIYKNSYAALIAASIIEKEAALSRERVIIAGVIVRRLKKKMYLQMDPTVIYGLGAHFSGDLTIRDLRKKTPYNTYTHKRLPPTPICMPSESSIYAALHPAAGTVLYFVAKGDGSHVFSATLKEHDKAIKKYQLKKSRGKDGAK